MPSSDSTIDFSTVLASAAHDMKNSLCMLIQSAELIQQEAAQLSDNAREELARLNYEANRMNSNLLQLLSLYRYGQNQLPIQTDQHYLSDITEEIILKNQYFSEQRHITISLEVAESLEWFFDRDLITNLLNDVLANALRYSRHQILLTAREHQGYLEIEVNDDGPGFPERMLQQSKQQMSKLRLSDGHTGLGLFFASLMAMAHKNHGKTGSIELYNGGKLPGGVFKLLLP